jgi:hypothetical protein
VELRVDRPIELGGGLAVVVYDARTGHVRHIHEEITLPGGREPTPDEATKEALRLAETVSGLKPAAHQTLVVKGHELDPEHGLRVDVEKRKLIPHPAPAPKLKRAER